MYNAEKKIEEDIFVLYTLIILFFFFYICNKKKKEVIYPCHIIHIIDQWDYTLFLTLKKSFN